MAKKAKKKQTTRKPLSRDAGPEEMVESDLLRAVDAATTSEKRAVTLNLTKSNYEEFQSLCAERGVKPSRVIDEWIRLYLNRVGV